MRSIVKGLVCVLLMIELSACRDKPYTLNYFLSHPLVLKKEISRCRELPNEITLEEKRECDLVNQAANQFMQVVDEEQGTPEKFGEKILHAQMDLANAKDQATKDRLTQEVQQLLAVVSLGAPE